MNLFAFIFCRWSEFGSKNTYSWIRPSKQPYVNWFEQCVVWSRRRCSRLIQFEKPPLSTESDETGRIIQWETMTVVFHQACWKQLIHTVQHSNLSPSSLLLLCMNSLQVSADIWRVHCVAGAEPVVLFKRGAVRLLDSLLSAPQQPIEEVLAQEEAIRSVSLTAPVNPLGFHLDWEGCLHFNSLYWQFNF